LYKKTQKEFITYFLNMEHWNLLRSP
jgi:hypothetical protein